MSTPPLHPRRRLARVGALLLAALLVGAASAQVRVVASLPPYASLAKLVTGELGDVTSLLPAGASPHGFDPSPRALRTVRNADLVLLNGGLDAWVLELLEAAGGGAELLVALDVAGVEAIAGEGHEHEDEHEDEREEEEHGDEHAEGEALVNPHVWLDPIAMVPVVRALGARLGEIDPANAARYAANADEAARRLELLDAQLREVLASAAGRPFVPFHDGWPYFARRYDLDLVIELEPFPGREPGPRYLAEALAAIRDSGAPAIFSERQLTDRPARVLAREAGVEVVLLDPLGEPDAGGYEAMLRANAEAVAAALDRPAAEDAP